MNIAEYMPHESISLILIKNENFPDIPFLSGTGFFVRIDPYEDIFFVTAKHCVYDGEDNLKGELLVHERLEKDCNTKVIFSELFFGKRYSENYIDDIEIYHVDKRNKEQNEILRKRSIRLINQYEVSCYLDILMKQKGKLRTIGFPGAFKHIEYDDKKLHAWARGFWGKLTKSSEDSGLFTLEDINWKAEQNDLGGFSGSPIIDFVFPTKEPVPLGVIITGSNNIVQFLSINIVTNLILNYLENTQSLS